MRKKLTPIYIAISYLALVILLLALMGCTTTKYVPIESTRTDTVYRYRLNIDSITSTDSIFVKEYIKGDTMFVLKTKWKIVEQIKIRYDTIYQSKNDSIQVPYPVEKELTKWQKTKQEVGGVAIGIATIGIIFVIVWLIRRFR